MVPCPRCGFAVPETGFQLADATFPDALDEVQWMATGARRFMPCRQCGADTSVEYILFAVFPAVGRVIVRPPTDATDAEVGELLGGVELPEGWTAEPLRDVDEFRHAVGSAALAGVRIDDDFAPSGARDREYHAALALIGRPGFIVFHHLSEGVTEQQARAQIDEARRFQLAISFFEAFANTSLAGFDPWTAVDAHFVPACFEDEEVIGLIAALIAQGEQPGDVAVLDAALGAAAGERRSPRRRELAEELVERLRAGVVLHDDPARWADLVDAEDVFRAAMGGRTRVEAPDELTAVAAPLGHGGEVLRRYRDRMRVDRVDDPGRLVDAVLEAGSGVGAAEALATFASGAEVGDAMRLLAELLERDEGALAVPVLRTLAKRLTDDGEPGRALALIDEAEDRLARDPDSRATVRNERGNALRALLDAEAALAEYEGALALLDDEHPDARVIRLNRARALRDAGHLPRAIAAFHEELHDLEGRQRFDALFALAIALQRNGQWQEAQPVLDEALELVRAEPLDDQLTRFALTRHANARALGRREDAALLDAVLESPFVSARQQLLTLAASSVAALRVTGPDSELGDHTRELVAGLGLVDLAPRDPEFALLWADAARLAGEVALARATIAAALPGLREPIHGIHACCVAAGMALDDARWDDVQAHVEHAAAFIARLAGTATAGTSTVTFADTLSDVRDLAARLAQAPPGHERLLGTVADLGSSLQLSVQIAREHLPVGGAVAAPAGTTLQILQWLDAGDAQIPLLTFADGDGTELLRGDALPTALVDGLGARLAGRVARTPALHPGDVLEELAPFGAFRDALDEVLDGLPIDPDAPLTVVPSGPMAGIPFLPERAVALAPSLAVAVALAHRAAEEPREPDVVGEVRCWCHGDGERLIAALTAGSDALRDRCAALGAEYAVVAGTGATRAGVEGLVGASTWLKLSCHGVTDPARARFALVLSDGAQEPPALGEVLDRPDVGDRYLFDWSEVSGARSRCRAVVSSACTSGSAGATAGGEQIGLARAFLGSGVLAFVAPLWPVAAEPAQQLVNHLLDRCLSEPAVPLAEQLARTRRALRDSVPPRVADAFVLHGHAGAVNA